MKHARFRAFVIGVVLLCLRQDPSSVSCASFFNDSVDDRQNELDGDLSDDGDISRNDLLQNTKHQVSLETGGNEVGKDNGTKKKPGEVVTAVKPTKDSKARNQPGETNGEAKKPYGDGEEKQKTATITTEAASKGQLHKTTVSTLDTEQSTRESNSSSSPSENNPGTDVAHTNNSVGNTNGFISVSVSVKKIQMIVVYESLCPYSRRFVYGQLLPAYSKLGSFIALTMLPFGKAKVRNETDAQGHNITRILCQHGKSECEGNMIETCVLRVVKRTLIAVKIVACMSENSSPHRAGQACVEANGVKWSEIDACVSQHGEEYELEVAWTTWTYQSVVTRVPLVIVDGDKGNYVNYLAQNNLMNLACARIEADGIEEPKSCAQERRRRRRRRR